MKKFGFLLIALTFASAIVSCEQEESTPDDSEILIEEIRGKYVVDFTWDGAPQGTNTISIYNTGANDADMMWIDDIEHSWGLKAKVPVNLGDLTFGGSNLDELYYGVTVTITEGKIVKGGATAPSGDIVDSIYFKAEFSDIPGEIWEYSGYKSTGKIDDLP